MSGVRIAPRSRRSRRALVAQAGAIAVASPTVPYNDIELIQRQPVVVADPPVGLAVLVEPPPFVPIRGFTVCGLRCTSERVTGRLVATVPTMRDGLCNILKPQELIELALGWSALAVAYREFKILAVGVTLVPVLPVAPSINAGSYVVFGVDRAHDPAPPTAPSDVLVLERSKLVTCVEPMVYHVRCIRAEWTGFTSTRASSQQVFPWIVVWTEGSAYTAFVAMDVEFLGAA